MTEQPPFETEQKELTDRTVFLVLMGMIVFVIILVTVASLITAVIHQSACTP
jgi:hypothetical protein